MLLSNLSHKAPKTGRTILLLATIGVLIGRGYQLFFFDGPLRTLMWDQDLLEPLIQLFGVEWNDYATNLSVDSAINRTHQAMACVLWLTVLLLLLPDNIKKLKTWCLWSSVFFLALLGLLGFKEHFFQLPMLFEYMLQLSAPIAMLHFYKHGSIKLPMARFLTACCSLTFLGHGLYATGIYTRPGKFIDLVIGTFHCPEEVATYLVLVAGILDILVAVLVFLKPLSKQMFLYMAVWGGITALSRLTAGVYFDFFWSSLNQSLPLVIYRLPHALIPLTLYYIHRRNEH